MDLVFYINHLVIDFVNGIMKFRPYKLGLWLAKLQVENKLSIF